MFHRCLDLIAAVDRHAEALRCLRGFALHLAVWTALPALLYPNLPLDLIEALTYGREWQLGYDKLPPLPWWLVEVVYRLFGVDAAYYALAQVAVVARLRAGLGDRAAAGRARRRAGRRADRRRPALLPLHGREVQSRRDPAAALGARRLRLSCARSGAAACCIGAARLRASAWRCGRNISSSCWRCRSRCFCCSTATPARRFATPGPWVALVVALVVMAPHLVWLVRNDFLPFAYAECARRAVARVARSHPASGGLRGRAVRVPAAGVADRRARSPWPRVEDGGRAAADAFDRRIVALLAFGPAVGRDRAWSASAAAAPSRCGAIRYGCFSACGSCSLRARRSSRRACAHRVAWAVVFAVFALAFVANYAVLPRSTIATARCSIRATRSARRAVARASAPPPASRSSM